MRSRGVVDVSTRSAEGVESVLDPLAEDLAPGHGTIPAAERSVRFQKTHRLARNSEVTAAGCVTPPFRIGGGGAATPDP